MQNKIAHRASRSVPDPLLKRLFELLQSMHELMEPISTVLDDRPGKYHIPQIVLQVIEQLLSGQSAKVVCDPYAGLGTLLASVRDAVHASHAIGFTPSKVEFELGHLLVSSADWHLGDPLSNLTSMAVNLDVVASILPFGAKGNRSIVLMGVNNNQIGLQDDLGHLLLVASAKRLHPDGVGIFVISPSFFLSPRSVYRHFANLGLAAVAALALPAATFAPYVRVQSYLVIVRKQAPDQMFVAQLSTDANTNAKILFNLKERKEGGRLDLGRFVDAASFTGLDSIRTQERLPCIPLVTG